MITFYKVLLGLLGTVAAGGAIGSAYKYGSDMFDNDSEEKEFLDNSRVGGTGSGKNQESLMSPPSLGDGKGKNISGSSSGSGTLAPSAQEESEELQKSLNDVVSDAVSRGTAIKRLTR